MIGFRLSAFGFLIFPVPSTTSRALHCCWPEDNHGRNRRCISDRAVASTSGLFFCFEEKLFPLLQKRCGIPRNILFHADWLRVIPCSFRPSRTTASAQSVWR